jgi:hypothetical protein
LLLLAIFGAPQHRVATLERSQPHTGWFWYLEKQPAHLETAFAPRGIEGRTLQVQLNATSGPVPKPVFVEFRERIRVIADERAPFFQTSIGACVAALISVALSWMLLKWASG